MIMFDFLFKICYAPFHKVEKGGRLAAIMILSPSLTFAFMGITIWLMSFLFGFKYSQISSLAATLIIVMAFIIIHFILLRIYVRNERSTGEMRYPVLFGLCIPFLIIGSVVFYAWVINEFG